jgi:hypothetical protein
MKPRRKKLKQAGQKGNRGSKAKTAAKRRRSARRK